MVNSGLSKEVAKVRIVRKLKGRAPHISFHVGKSRRFCQNGRIGLTCLKNPDTQPAKSIFAQNQYAECVPLLLYPGLRVLFSPTIATRHPAARPNIFRGKKQRLRLFFSRAIRRLAGPGLLRRKVAKQRVCLMVLSSNTTIPRPTAAAGG